MVTLARKVEFLGREAAYGARGKVRAIETHMSWVFLAGGHAYKLKKPVRYPFLDFGSIEARRRHCEAEVRLNGRLAGGTYLGVVPLCASGGQLAIGGEGEIVDWLVKMRRLPDADMLDARIRKGDVGPEQIDAVGERLAAFYLAAPPEIEAGHVYLDRLMAEQAVNRDVLGRPEFGLGDRIALVDDVSRALRAVRPAIESRIAAGRIVEGHGDLRPEHICLADPPLVIDCLEFNHDMRIVDPYDEINYLGLECELLGAGWIRPRLLSEIDRRLDAFPGQAYVATLGAFRAVTRARISLAHLFDPEPRRPEHWPRLARSYLAMAERELIRS